jgi:plasmid stabilization system protein ParE
MYIEWTPKARGHIQNIIDYYKPINPIIALKIIDKIESKADFLASFPRMGKAGLIKDTCELLVTSTPYFLVYELLPDQNNPEIISIMAVFSSRQDRYKR